MKKNLILGAIKDYGWYDIEPFFRSWKANCPNTDVVIFADNLLHWTRRQLETFPDVKIVDISCNDKLIIDVRWTFYRQYMEQARNVYHQVLTTDVRDVIFQKNPFQAHQERGAYLEYATEGVSIEDTPSSNALWIKMFFGENTYLHIKDHTVICCGTVCGTMDAMLVLARKMEELLARSNFWGAEQAIMNYLVYNKLLPFKNILESNIEDGNILTLSGLPNAAISGVNVLSRSGKVPALVHQYDRHQELTQLVDKAYRSPAFPTETDASDVNDMLDILDFLWHNHKEDIVFSQLCELAEQEASDLDGQLSYDRVLRLLRTHMEIPAASIKSSFIEQTLQHLLTKAKNIDLLQIESFWKIITSYRQQKKTLCKPFEHFVGNCTWQAAVMMENDADCKGALLYLERLVTIDYPLNSEYYLLLAKIHRLLGNKENALKAYKNALAGNPT